MLTRKHLQALAEAVADVAVTHGLDEVEAVDAGDPTVDETRSQWQWFRLPNGDLVLGVFPQGDTYFSVVDRARI